jgi:hypothetical protein
MEFGWIEGQHYNNGDPKCICNLQAWKSVKREGAKEKPGTVGPRAGSFDAKTVIIPDLRRLQAELETSE